MFSAVSKEDITLASSQLADVPEGNARDGGILGILPVVMKEDPSSGVQWALAIDDLELRSQTVASSFESWARKDLAAAEAWLDESGQGLGEDLHQNLTGAVVNQRENPRSWSRSVTSGFGTVIAYY